MSVLNHPKFSSAYFFPVDTRCEHAIEVNVGDAVLRCHHHCPNPEFPTLVHFHGNGEGVAPYVTGEFPKLVQRKTRGMNTLMIEYRGYGGSTGDVEIASMLPDGAAVLGALNIDPARSIAYGRSIGSLYAIELAHRCPTLAGLVIDSGIADIRKPFLEFPTASEIFDELGFDEVQSEIDKWFNHQEKISRYAGRLLILHAKNDRLIDVEHAYSLNRWATSETKQLRVYVKGDHNTIFQVNHDDMMNSLSYMAEKLFRECELPILPSIRYEPSPDEIGVEISGPIKKSKRYEERMQQKEREMQAWEDSGRREELDAIIESIKAKQDSGIDQAEVLPPSPSRSFLARVFSLFR